LGLDPEVPARVRRELGVVVGETTSLPGGPAGARFRRAALALLAGCGVEVRDDRVQKVEPVGGRWRISCESERQLNADAVVLATGGVVAGGIVLDAANQQVKSGGFCLGMTAPLELSLGDQATNSVASLHGFDFTEHGLGVLLTVGARPVRGTTGLLCAGDLMAGRPNTMLEAVASGVAAATRLCVGEVTSQPHAETTPVGPAANER
jgi:anaerobic glycerol-3-phosphate dehydrogenase